MDQNSQTKLNMYKRNCKSLNKSLSDIFVISLIIIGVILDIVLTIQYNNKHIPLAVMFKALTAYFLISTILLIIFMPLHPSKYGLHLKNWRSELIIGFFIGIIGLFISAIVGKTLVSTGFKTTENIVFGTHWTGLFSVHNLQFMFFYLVGSFIQETVSKGYFQSYLIGVFSKRSIKGFTVKAVAIIISSLFFSLFHAAGGIYLCLITFAFSILLGILYERERSLIAISFIHFFCGTGAFLVSLYI